MAAAVIAHDVLIHAIGQKWVFATPIGGAITDRAAITSLTGYLSRRVDSGGRFTGDPALAGRISDR